MDSVLLTENLSKAGLAARQARARREQLLAELGIAEVAHQVPGRISGG